MVVLGLILSPISTASAWTGDAGSFLGGLLAGVLLSNQTQSYAPYGYNSYTNYGYAYNPSYTWSLDRTSCNYGAYCGTSYGSYYPVTTYPTVTALSPVYPSGCYYNCGNSYGYDDYRYSIPATNNFVWNQPAYLNGSYSSNSTSDWNSYRRDTVQSGYYTDLADSGYYSESVSSGYYDPSSYTDSYSSTYDLGYDYSDATHDQTYASYGFDNNFYDTGSSYGYEGVYDSGFSGYYADASGYGSY